jgi:hypothetical protein
MSDRLDAELEPVLKAKGMAQAGDLATLVNKAGKSTIAVSLVPDGAVRQQMQGMTAMAGPGGKAMGVAMSSAKGFGFWATLGSSDVELKLVMLMPDAAAAQKLTSDMQAESQKAGGDPAAKMMMALMPAGLKALMQEATESQQFTTDGNMSVVSARIKMTTLEGAIGDAAKMVPGPGGPPPAAQPSPAGEQPPTRGPRRAGRSGGGSP